VLTQVERWERGVPTGGFPLADGTSAKALTGIDDHSRMCVRHPHLRRHLRNRQSVTNDGQHRLIPLLAKLNSLT